MRYIVKLTILRYNFLMYLHILTKKNVIVLEKDYLIFKK